MKHCLLDLVRWLSGEGACRCPDSTPRLRCWEKGTNFSKLSPDLCTGSMHVHIDTYTQKQMNAKIWLKTFLKHCLFRASVNLRSFWAFTVNFWFSPVKYRIFLYAGEGIQSSTREIVLNHEHLHPCKLEFLCYPIPVYAWHSVVSSPCLVRLWVPPESL